MAEYMAVDSVVRQHLTEMPAITQLSFDTLYISIIVSIHGGWWGECMTGGGRSEVRGMRQGRGVKGSEKK